MEFVAIDFETATAAADSPCELGIAIVRDGALSEVRSWLIKPRQWPHFSPWNVGVHGIRPVDVAHAPGWAAVWEEVRGLLDGSTVVAHNAAFDMTVLRSTLATHGLSHPSFRYFCSVSMARRVWPGLGSYGLAALCGLQGIPLRHHRAGDDAEATARLVLRAAGDGSDIMGFLQAKRVALGGSPPGGQRTPGGKEVPRAVSLQPMA